MSHLTDGQLHAYMDGSAEALDGGSLVEARSHILACKDCRARLEAARAVRDEAASLLDAASPASLSPPTFEELERRAAGAGHAVTPVGTSRKAGYLVRRPGSLAWAASLAVALTAGWLARGMVGPGTVGQGGAEFPAAAAPTETAALEGNEADFRAESSPAVESAPERKEGLDQAVVGAEETTFGAADAAEPQPDAGEPPSYAAVPPSDALADRGDVVEEDTRARRRLDRVKPEPATEMEAEGAGSTAEAERQDAELAAEMEPREAAKMARQEAEGRSASILEGVAGPADWRPVPRERAAALLGGAVKTVEGLPVLSVYARETAGAPEVWTAQQLSSGHTLNLWQTPLGDGRVGDQEAGEDAYAERDQRPADDPISERETVPPQQAYYESLERLRIDGFLIEARAPLPADSLRILLSRLRD